MSLPRALFNWIVDLSCASAGLLVLMAVIAVAALTGPAPGYRSVEMHFDDPTHEAMQALLDRESLK